MTTIEKSLTHHTPSPEQITVIEDLRSAAIAFGAAVEATPSSRERSLALTNLEQSLMWAVKGVILN